MRIRTNERRRASLSAAEDEEYFMEGQHPRDRVAARYLIFYRAEHCGLIYGSRMQIQVRPKPAGVLTCPWGQVRRGYKWIVHRKLAEQASRLLSHHPR